MKILKILKKCFRNNESGFSLAELMVAAGIVGVISVALTRIMTQATKTQRKVTADMTINETNIHIRNILRNEANCTAAFKDLSFTAGIKPNGNKVVQYNKAGAVVASYTIGDSIGQGSGGKVTLKNIVSEAPTSLVAPSGTTPGRGEITINFFYSRIDETRSAEAQAQLKKMTYGGQEVNKPIKIMVDYNSANKIIGCNADLSDYQEEMCTTGLQGQWDDVNDLCKSILIEPAPDTFRKISFGTQNAVIKEGVQIGSTASINFNTIDLLSGLGVNTPPTGAGNVNITGTYTTAHPTSGVNAKLNNTSLRFSSNGAVVGTPDNVMTLNSDYAVFNKGVQVATDLKLNRDIFSTTTGSSGGVLISGGTVATAYPRLWVRPSGYSILAQGTGTSSIAFQVNNGLGQVDTVPAAAYPLAPASRDKMVNAGWVNDFLFEGIANNMANNSSIIGQLIANMASYAVSQPMNAVSNMMCGKFKMVKTKYSATGAAINSTVSGSVGSNGACTYTTPDINCTKSGECARVCIGTDCRTSWPAPDGVCSTSGQCARVCIGTTCKTRWPRLVFGNLNIGYCTWRGYAWNYGNPRVLCAGQEVVRGLQRNSAGTPTNALCCRHRNEMDAVWSN